MLLLALCALAAPQVAPTPSLLFQNDSTLPTGEVIRLAYLPASNANGGSSVQVWVTDQSGDEDFLIYGAFDRSDLPSILLSGNAQFPPKESSRFQSAHSMSAAGLLVNVSWSDPSSPCQTDFLYEDGAILRCLDLGTINTIDQTARGDAPQSRVFAGGFPISIFRGDPNTPDLQVGDILAGTTHTITWIQDPVQASDGKDPVLAARGDHYGCVVRLDGGIENSAVIDGQQLFNDGVPVRAGELVIPSAGPNSARWIRLDEALTNDSGDWWVAGRIDDTTAQFGVIVKNGVIARRRGDLVDGQVLRGAPKLVPMANGDVAESWGGGIIGQERLVIGDRLVLWSNQVVDYDMDGVADPNATLRSFESLSVDVDEDFMVRATGRALLSDGTNLFGVYEVQTSFGQLVCSGVENSTGQPSVLEAFGTQLIGESDLRLQLTGLPTGSLGYVIASQDVGFSTNPGGSTGNLCLGGEIGRDAGNVLVANADGQASTVMDLSMIPQPMASVAAQVGESWSFQYWHRDTTAQGAATTNFSSAVTILAR